MLNLLLNWRTTLWFGLLVFLVVGSLIPQVGALLLAAWWTECQSVGMACWRVVRRAVTDTRRRQSIRWIGHWVGRVAAVGLVVWLVGYWVRQPRGSLWIWAVLVCVWHGVLCIERRVAAGAPATRVSISAADTVSEIVVDLEPLLAEMGEVSRGVAGQTQREALEAQFERIRGVCFKHPVGRILMERVEREVKLVLRQVIEGALEEELREHVGGAAYARGERVRGEERQRSGSWVRGVRTVSGEIKVRVPKLRRGNGQHEWRVLRRYERAFGPWLDVQLHLYRLGLSQRDLQETLWLGFGQALSAKGIEHVIAVTGEELQAFREARLQETPPVLVVDGVLVKVLLPTGVYRLN